MSRESSILLSLTRFTRLSYRYLANLTHEFNLNEEDWDEIVRTMIPDNMREGEDLLPSPEVLQAPPHNLQKPALKTTPKYLPSPSTRSRADSPPHHTQQQLKHIISTLSPPLLEVSASETQYNELRLRVLGTRRAKFSICFL